MVAKWYLWFMIGLYIVSGISELLELGSESTPKSSGPKTRKGVATAFALTLALLVFAVAALYSLPEVQ